MTVPLSVLDLVPLSDGAGPSRALRNSLELARHVDALGYQRLWYAEHHNMGTIASTTPAIMIAMAGEVTTRIRVGAGGVMLPNHAPLAVAEAYKMLEALHPGRVDLGIGRAPGTDPAAAKALRGPRADADDFPQRLAELMAYGLGTIPAGHPLQGVNAVPKDAPLPPIWILGSSTFGAEFAAMLGKGFGFAAHFSDLDPVIPMRLYRDNFAPQTRDAKPHAILTLSVICAPTDAEAEHLASSLLVSFARLRTGQPPMLLPPDEAANYPFTPREHAVAEAIRPLHLTGSPETVRARIEDLVERTRADEVMVTTFTYGHAERLRSYELLAGAFAR